VANFALTKPLSPEVTIAFAQMNLENEMPFADYQVREFGQKSLLSEHEFEREVNSTSSSYVRHLQRPLNCAPASQLPVDGTVRGSLRLGSAKRTRPQALSTPRKRPRRKPRPPRLPMRHVVPRRGRQRHLLTREPATTPRLSCPRLRIRPLPTQLIGPNPGLRRPVTRWGLYRGEGTCRWMSLRGRKQSRPQSTLEI
jgi:hypothetical protein